MVIKPQNVLRFPRSRKEARNTRPANITFPRTQQEAGWTPDAEWYDENGHSGAVTRATFAVLALLICGALVALAAYALYLVIQK